MPTVLALGAWLKNTACLVLHKRPYWSPVHGDLSDPTACSALEASVQALLAQAQAAGAPVQAIAHDLHPDFFSTQLAIATADMLDVPAIGVQHHHAHLAAVIAEHAVTEPVLGIAVDGMGWGADNTPWGGELLWLDGPRYQRLGHLRTLAMPGGDRAAREPWRMAASALHAMGRADEIVPRFGREVGQAMAAGVHQMLDKNFKCPMSSSAGRWLDAAAGALGLCHHQRDEAQAAIALEQAANRALLQRPDLSPLSGAALLCDGRVDMLPVLEQLFDATDIDAAAAGFHLSLADALVDALIQAARARGIRITLLSGGCFVNRILRERTIGRLVDAGLCPLLPGPQGCGDAGLAIGQAWVAEQLITKPNSTPNEETVSCA